MKTAVLLPIVSLALFLAGCAQSNESVRAHTVEAAHIQAGVTTEQDLVAKLGEPQIRGFDFKKRRMLVWNRVAVSSTNTLVSMSMLGRFLPEEEMVEQPELTVSLDPNGHVVEWRLTTERHHYR